MTLGRLRAALTNVGITPTPEELAEILWLAPLSGPASTPAADVGPGEDDGSAPAPTHASGPSKVPVPPPTPPPEPAAKPLSHKENRLASDDVPVHLPGLAGTTNGIGAVPAHVPGVRALADPLAFARALRPLKQHVPAAGREIIDEHATAEWIAEQGLWLPVVTPTPERWLDLAIVVDDAASMIIWGQLVRELRQLMEQLGAFRDVRLWRLATDLQAGQRNPVLRGETSGAASRDPRELVDPSGRRIVVIVSDCLGSAWRTGAMTPLLTAWGAAGPVAILQPLPLRLWNRTGLPAVPAALRAFRPGQPNAELQVRSRPAGRRPASPAVPVLELGREWIAPWVRLVANTGTGWTNLAVGTDRTAPTADAAVGADPGELVGRFRQESSASAFRLASYLSAVPLSLPVMRLVQRAKLPESRPSQLAEVFLGGLLVRTTPAAPVASDEVQYDFPPGVREILLSTITRTDAIGLLEDVARFLAGPGGSPLNFRALLADPYRSGGVELDRASKPFAKVAQLVLTRLAPRPAPAPEPEPTKPDVRVIGSSTPWRPTARPMIFVGLGGTGCRIGVELERNLRARLCGPDGTNLVNLLPEPRLPYQLPAYLQFVYADPCERDLAGLSGLAVPGPEHIPAAARTAHLTSELVPRFDTYPEVARSLRLNVPDVVQDWLPTADNEPRIGPISRGSGQLPMVARAMLFEALRHRHTTGAIVRHLDEALSAISRSSADLAAMGGGRPGDQLDVFLAFSVAGGTGAGTFYDYLHLIGDELQRSGYRASIHPLVVLPSAFEPGVGGGRPADLNAASALVDLFRLIDSQNNYSPGLALVGPSDLGVPGVRYPGGEEIRLRPSTVQSAHLFGRPVGAKTGDVHRSVADLVELLSQLDGGAADTTLADTIISGAVDRSRVAPDGLGGEGVTTTQVVTFQPPVAELADLVSRRLLAEAVDTLVQPPPEEHNRDLIVRYFIEANIEPLLRREAPSIPEPTIASGSLIQPAFEQRADAMRAAVETLEIDVASDAHWLAEAFDPQRGISRLAEDLDPFRLARVLFGYHETDDSVSRLGAVGLVRDRGRPPEAPPGVIPDPMSLDIPTRRFGRVSPSDPAIRKAFSDQDVWYLWRARTHWHMAWQDQARRWSPKLERSKLDYESIVETFREHARQSTDDQRSRARNLRLSQWFRFDGDVDTFYQRFLEHCANRTAADVVDAILRPDDWRAAIARGMADGPEEAVIEVLNRLRNGVRTVFEAPGGGPFLPTLADLLADADESRWPAVSETLATLIHVHRVPSGRGTLRVLILYPAETRNQAAEARLVRELNLPDETGMIVELHPTTTDTLTVAMFRTGMGITAVPEAQRLLKVWKDARREAGPADYLPWRRRLGEDFGMVATEDQQAAVVQRFLCAIWNGQVVVEGDAVNPAHITVRTGLNVTMQLELTPLDGHSSWSGLPAAYERWCVADDNTIRAAFAEQLMRTLPRGLEGRPHSPDPLYRKVIELATREATASDDSPRSRRRQQFWKQTFPAALERPFYVDSPYNNLRQLFDNGP